MDQIKQIQSKYSNVLQFSLLNYLQAFVSFGTSILLARSVGRDLYGDYALGLVFFNTISTLNQFGSEKTLVRDLVQSKNPQSILKAATLVSVLISAIIFLSVIIWLKVSKSSYQVSIILILFSIAGILRGISPVAWFDYVKKMRQQALLAAAEKILFFISVVCLIFFSAEKQILIISSLLFLMCRMMFSFQEWKLVINDLDADQGDFVRSILPLVRQNILIWLTVIANLMMSQVNQLMLNTYSGSKQLATYAVAFQLIMIIRLFQRQFLRIIAPSIAVSTIRVEGYKKRELILMRRKLHRHCFKLLFVTLSFSAPLFLFAPIIISNIVGESYFESIAIFRILLIWSVVFGQGLIVNQFLIGLHFNKVVLFTSIILGICSLLLSHSLIPSYQGNGAALALLLSHSAAILVQFIFLEISLHRRGASL